MTEIPEHLLKRSRERRSAMGGGGGDTGGGTPASPAAAATPSAAVEKASAAPAKAAAAPAKAAAAPKPEPAYIQAAKARNKRKIPIWAMPVLAILPVWALLYQYSLTPAEKHVEGPLAVGETVYGSLCVACHLANGAGDSAGGVGRQLSQGQVLLTFPTFADHLEFVRAGGPAAGTPYGDPAREGGQQVARGGMPGFASLTEEELIGVVCHERVTLAGGALEENPECAAAAE